MYLDEKVVSAVSTRVIQEIDSEHRNAEENTEILDSAASVRQKT